MSLFQSGGLNKLLDFLPREINMDINGEDETSKKKGDTKMSIEETMNKIEKIMEPYGISSIKDANKAMKKNFNIAEIGLYRNDSCETTYYYDIIRNGEEERYYYDFWNGQVS